jgi:hypothetical protein
LFGDERYVFATPHGSTKAKVYSAIDGRALGEATVPAWEHELTTRGRRVIRWKTNKQSEFELTKLDPLTGDVAWQRTFSAGARVDIDMDRYIAVAEPSGRAVILDETTGDVLFEASLTPQARLDQVHLRAGTDHFVLVVEHPSGRNADREVRPFNAGDSTVVDGEVLVLDGRAGGSRWARPASVLRQALVLNQPADLPFVLFAGALLSRTRGEGHDATTALLLDKATGRTLFASDELPQSSVASCTAEVTDLGQHEVTVEIAGRSLVVQLTEGRRPPEPPAMAEVESSAGKISEGILGILNKALGE